MDIGKRLLMEFAENEQREALSEADCSSLCEELLRLYPKWTLKDLASALNKDPSWVTRHHSVSKVLPAVREAFEAGQLKISQVYPISQVSERDQHELLATALGGASKDDLERAVKRIKRPNRNGSARLSRVRCPLMNATVIVSGAAIGLDEAIDAVLAAAKEMKRARDEGLDAKTAQAVWQKRTAKAAH
jgi:hypothetical protein